MKVYWLWVLVSMAIALLLLSFSSTRPSSSLPDVVVANHAHSLKARASGRKLKDISYNGSEKKGGEFVNLEDYRPYDPSPSSKAKIKPGPIEHGSPLIPHIPKHPPPQSPQYRR